MHLIYLHGLDSDPTATKASQTHAYACEHNIAIHIPNLNCPPDEVLNKVQALITSDTVLIGSSLGGYFASLISDLTGVPCVLLNPSIRPDLSFKRFLQDNSLEQASDNSTIYTTTGGWEIKFGDLAWFEQHRLSVKHPAHQAVFLSMDDELLDATSTQKFYSDKGVAIYPKPTGGHRMEDYQERLGEVVRVAQSLLKE